MNISLYEYYEQERLLKVINCGNLPFDGTETKEWKDNLKKQMIKMYRLKKKNGKVEIIYKQPNKYGRYFSNTGYQSCKRDIRKYINNGHDVDIDIVNCCPSLLIQIFKDNIIDCGDFLRDYVSDREATIKKYSLNDKMDFIKMINNDTLKDQRFKEIHELTYKHLVPKLIKENKVIYNRVKKNRKRQDKEHNIDGAFLSAYVQDKESIILMSMYNFLISRGFTVSTLCFDGLLVEKVEGVDELLLRDSEEEIFLQTKFKISLAFKSMETDWVPQPPEKIDLKDDGIENPVFYIKTLNRSLAKNCLSDDGAAVSFEDVDILVKYLNNFVCEFIAPTSTYGIRNNVAETFQLCKKHQAEDRIKYAFNNKLNPDISWCHHPDQLQYDKIVFEVDQKRVGPRDYNLYQRPAYQIKEGVELKEFVPNFYEFLFGIMADSDEKLYFFLINYISKKVCVGKAKQLLVLMGQMGSGKSTFAEMMGLILGKKYWQQMDSIHQISSNFNASYETAIFSSVEEIVSNAGDFHAIQSKLKTLTTETSIRIEKKGIDSYMTTSQNDICLITNECNPVKITDDNRRAAVLKVSNKYQNDHEFFSRLRKEVKENIEFIRGYFFNFKYNDNLNSIRPTTKAEAELLVLNENNVKTFVRDELSVSGDETFKFIYQRYSDFCAANKYKAASGRYFSIEMKKEGFSTYRKGISKTTYFKVPEHLLVSDENIF